MGSLVLNDGVARDPLHHNSWMNSSAMRSGSALETDRQHSAYDAWNSHSSQQTTPSPAPPSQQHDPSSSSLSSTSTATTTPQPLSSSTSFKPTPEPSSARRSGVGDVVPGHEAPPSPTITPSDHTPSAQPAAGVTESANALEATSHSTESPTPTAASPRRIKVRDLQHIQAVAREDPDIFGPPRPQSGSSQHDTTTQSPQFEISDMPVADVIEMVAGLLTKITTTNDRQHEHLHRNPIPDGTTTLSQTTSSVLSFHGKNVPSITILSYLSRIHKYCPTTYEIFLSLLVYFDRMTDRVNSGPLQNLRRASHQSLDKYNTEKPRSNTTVASSVSAETLPTAAQRMQTQQALTPTSQEPPSPPLSDSDPYLSHFFVVDSFNIHRLVIAGVTCASKFFSDVFYTNSRYAKVGGLPLVELNHLELQFLLLNDFRLSIAVEELEAYATMLVEFYAREVLAQQSSQPESMATNIAA